MENGTVMLFRFFPPQFGTPIRTTGLRFWSLEVLCKLPGDDPSELIVTHAKSGDRPVTGRDIESDDVTNLEKWQCSFRHPFLDGSLADDVAPRDGVFIC
jgi:hypothetical protein